MRIDKKNAKHLARLLKHCTDKNNPKFELNFVLVDGNKLVATDTKQIVVIEFQDAIYSDASKINNLIMLMPKNSHKYPLGMPSILSNLEGYELAPVNGRYADYTRILPKNEGFEKFNQSFKNAACYFYWACKYKDTVFNPDLLCKFFEYALGLGLKEIEFKQVEKNMPLYIKGFLSNLQAKVTYAVMPVID